MMSLTPRQQDALRFVIGYQEANGVGPLVKEIAAALSCRSTNVASWLMRVLEERGAVVRLGPQWRAIAVVETIPIPRTPDGTPLQFIRMGESAA